MDDAGRGFTLTWVPNVPGSADGYWYACTADNEFDADGSSIEEALANLITVLDRARKEGSAS